MKKIDELFPWYINNSLDNFDREEIARALKNSNKISREVEYWRKVSRCLRNRPQKRPSESVLVGLRHEIHTQLEVKNNSSNIVFWLCSFACAMLLLIAMWQSIQPGVSLQWSVKGDLPKIFRVYRAQTGSTDFILQKEIFSMPDSFQYRYVDLLSLPGGSYIYKVEGVGATGSITLSQNLVIPPLAAFPAQLVILLTSLVGGYAIATFVEVIALSFLKQRRFTF